MRIVYHSNTIQSSKTVAKPYVLVLVLLPHSKVNCNKLEISNDNKICVIAGPCQLETEQHAIDMSGKIKEITTKLGINFIYKTSFDKANRTSLKGKRGAGLET